MLSHHPLKNYKETLGCPPNTPLEKPCWIHPCDQSCYQFNIIKAHLHDTTSRIRFLSWRMKTIADATIPVYQFMAKFKIWHFYTHLFEYIRQDKNRIRLVISCRWALRHHNTVWRLPPWEPCTCCVSAARQFCRQCSFFICLGSMSVTLGSHALLKTWFIKIFIYLSKCLHNAGNGLKFK